ncbi:MAG TPA: CARDB domain-containing protein, partial [Candidatus Thermoplasmatota archaeon]|nr:CARDB domain-containing protein [Candidatus Thermoplasmatota archaeon]
AVSQNTTQTRVGFVTMSVRAYYGLALDSSQATGVPGRLTVPLRVLNTGNSRDTLQVTGGNLPPGWKLVPSAGAVDPYSEGSVDLVLDVPTSTPRGIYEVLARVTDAAGVEASAVIGVSILDYQAAVPHLAEPRATVRPQSLVESKVTLANEGNVRSEATLEATAPAGWTVEVSRPALVLDPGEEEDVDLRVLVPGTAPFGVHEVRLTATSGDPARGGVVKTDVLKVAVSESDLHVLELDYAPRVGIQAGEAVNFTAVVRNDGAIGAKAVGLAFYVDDVLAGYETLDGLAAGGERTVSFRWTSFSGEHVVLAILDPGNELREVDEANNARLEIVRVGRQVGILAAAEEAVPVPSVLWVLAAVAAVALAARGASKRKD